MAKKAEVAPPSGPELEAQVNELIEAYRRVTRQTYLLPFVSVWPLLVFYFHYLVFFIGVFVDLLLVPYNLIALLLRRFANVKAPYIMPFWKRLKYSALYIWRGEYFAPIIVRPLVRWLVKYHIGRRLQLLGEMVHLREDLDAALRDALVGRLSAEQARYFIRDPQEVLRQSLVPALVVGAVSFGAGLVEDQALQKTVMAITYFLGGMIGFYVLSVVIGAFPVKRGLFLGRIGGRTAYPGGAPGQGLYAVERNLFESFPIRPREIALDLWFLPISMLLSGVLNWLLARFIQAFSAAPDLGEEFLRTLTAPMDDIYFFGGNSLTEYGWYTLASLVMMVVLRVLRGVQKRC